MSVDAWAVVGALGRNMPRREAPFVEWAVYLACRFTLGLLVDSDDLRRANVEGWVWRSKVVNHAKNADPVETVRRVCVDLGFKEEEVMAIYHTKLAELSL